MHEAEEDLGIIFPPSQIKLMLVESVSLKECLSGSINLDTEETKKDNHSCSNKETLLQELRDFVVESNNINVQYVDKPFQWGKQKVALQIQHDLTAIRFEKKEIGEIFGM